MGYDRGIVDRGINRGINGNQMDFHLVQNRKENCRHDHILFNVKGNGILVFSVLGQQFVGISPSEVELFQFNSSSKLHNIRRKSYIVMCASSTLNSVLVGISAELWFAVYCFTYLRSCTDFSP